MKTTPLLVPAVILFQLSAAGAPVPPGTPVKVWGKLHFASRKAGFEGTNVGQEGDERRYIGGHPNSPQRAVWRFEQLPKRLTTARGDAVQVRLKCAHFALTGQDERAALVVVRAVSHTCPQVPPNQQQLGEWQWAAADRKEQYRAERSEYRGKGIDPDAAGPGTGGWRAANALAEKYGFYEASVVKVPDLEEVSIDLPAGLFRNASKEAPKAGVDGKPGPLVSIYVKCESKGLFLGVQETDLYLVGR